MPTKPEHCHGAIKMLGAGPCPSSALSPQIQIPNFLAKELE